MASYAYSGSHTRRGGGGGLSGFSSYFSEAAAPPLDALLSMAPLSPVARKHVAGVYMQLAAMMIVTVGAVYAELSRMLPRLDPLFTGLGLIGLTVAFMFVGRTKDSLNLRRGIMFGIAALKGLVLAPLVEMLGFISPRIVPVAATYTALIFLCFSVAAMYSRRRSMMYVGGLVGSGLSILAWMGLINIFMRSPVMFRAELYLGLLVFAGFIVYDTQVMIYKASQPMATDVDRKHAQMSHALDLYVDLVAVFVRIAVILAEREGKKGRRRDDSNGEGSTRRR